MTAARRFHAHGCPAFIKGRKSLSHSCVRPSHRSLLCSVDLPFSTVSTNTAPGSPRGFLDSARQPASDRETMSHRAYRTPGVVSASAASKHTSWTVARTTERVFRSWKRHRFARRRCLEGLLPQHVAARAGALDGASRRAHDASGAEEAVGKLVQQLVAFVVNAAQRAWPTRDRAATRPPSTEP